MVITIIYFIITATVMAYFMRLKTKCDDTTPEWQMWIYCGFLGLFWPIVALIVLWMAIIPRKTDEL